MIKELLTSEIQKFIQDHQNDDPASLMLQSGKYTHLPMVEIVEQIKARQKLKKKLPDWVKNKDIIFPAALSREQCSSQQTALFKSKIISGNIIVDLTGGSGVDTWFLSQKFSKVFYVEPNKELFNLAKHNLAVLGASNIEYFNQKAEDFLKSGFYADWVYIDPDRRGGNDKKLVLLTDCKPDILQLLNKIWLKTSAILIKASPMLDISATVTALGNVDSIHVVAVDNEVKEVLYLLKKIKANSLKIHTINFAPNGFQQLFQFNYHNEKYIEPDFSVVKEYLYEPNAAILKGGAYKSIAHEFNVSKLNPNTHLYTSNHIIKEFPGRIFKIIAVLPFQKKQLLEQLPEKKANITTRNFPISVDAIRKKTGIKDGGNKYLFAITDIDNKHVIAMCEKI